MLRGQASAFNAVGTIWAPVYRQAAFGAFLSDKPDSAQAKALAYTDVLAAFDAFQTLRDVRRPFLLAGHSQGALHLRQLLKDRIAGRPAQSRLVAAYLIGWPVSLETDLAPLGLDICQTPSATGCIISWSSFGPEADLTKMRAGMDTIPTLSGKPRKGTRLVCVNPVSFWAANDLALRTQNLGALPFTLSAMPVQPLKPHVVGAQCDAATGLLKIGPAPGDPFEERKMPGDNYHAYDISLFWANIRANAEIRVENFIMPR
jgi:hypothetical protein